ncbi:MAG: HAD hydrolase family protein [Elusimicrobiales bacterium]|nr:HAD hydrolase family protein [Elusimicrobiales bacterium]
MKKLSVEERAKKIKIVLMDVDGVLTDGTIHLLPAPGRGFYELKGFSALDGIGLRLLRTFGITTGLITGRKAEGTVERARVLCVRFVYQGFLSKTGPFGEILAKTGLRADEAAYIGDDLTDIPVLKAAGLAVAPANAVPEVKECAHVVTKLGGGSGAVREACDLILKAQGHWPEVMRMADNARWDKLPDEELDVYDAP